MPLLMPNAEMIAVHWLRSIISDTTFIADAATSLPAEQRWTQPVWVMAQLVAGRVDNSFPEHFPIIQVDTFARKGNWNQAFSAAEVIRNATHFNKGLGLLDLKPGFYPVNLADVSLFNEPRPIRDDRTGLSRIIMDLQLTYVPAGEYENDQGM